MKKPHFLIGFATLLLGFTASQKERVVEQNSFTTGEHIEYRVHYGFVNAAEAVVDVDNKVQTVNGRPCYKVVVFGRTTGMTDWVTKVRDTWASYIDTAAILPHQFYTKKIEGNYQTEERAIFDHNANTVKTYELDDDHEKKSFEVPDNVQDVVSGYYFLRTVDFDKMKVGETVLVNAFFDGEIYKMRFKLRGKEIVKTKFGKVNTFKISPMLPKNDFFQDENSVRLWVTDDSNKIPVRIEVELKIGTIDMDIKKYSGLRNEMKFL